MEVESTCQPGGCSVDDQRELRSFAVAHDNTNVEVICSHPDNIADHNHSSPQFTSNDAGIAMFADLSVRAENYHNQSQQDSPVTSHLEDSETPYDTLFGLSCVCGEDSKHILPEHIMEGSLFRGRAIGWRIFRQLAFPPLNNLSRFVWIVIQLLVAVVLLSLSLATFVLGNREVSNIVHLSLSSFALLLAILDFIWVMISHVWKSRSKARSRRVRAEIYSTLVVNENVENDMHESYSMTKTPCLKTRTVLDFLRLILPELILFPLVVCDVFTLMDNKTNHSGSTANWIAFVELIVSSISLVTFVYIFRLLVLGVMIYNVHRCRAPPSQLQVTKEQRKRAGYKPVLRKLGLCYLLCFFFHVLAQIVNQVFLIFAIGVKINDYLDPNAPNTPRAFLWCMIVTGYLLPVVGVWIFFSVTHHWLQEYPIALTLDTVSLLKLPGAGRIFFPRCSDEEIQLRIRWINDYTNFDTLSEDFKKLRFRTSFSKLWYPFKNWAHILICLSYATIQISFIVISILSSNGNTTNLGTFIVAGVIEVLANFYAISITFFWIMVFAFILIALAVFLCSIKIWICLFLWWIYSLAHPENCLQSSASPRQTPGQLLPSTL